MIFTPCDFSITGISPSRVALRAVASTSRATKKCGTVVQLCVVRSAMMRPIELTASAGPLGIAGAGAAGLAAGVWLAGATFDETRRRDALDDAGAS